jgi:hypothetical protein
MTMAAPCSTTEVPASGLAVLSSREALKLKRATEANFLQLGSKTVQFKNLLDGEKVASMRSLVMLAPLGLHREAN